MVLVHLDRAAIREEVVALRGAAGPVGVAAPAAQDTPDRGSVGHRVLHYILLLGLSVLLPAVHNCKGEQPCHNHATVDPADTSVGLAGARGPIRRVHGALPVRLQVVVLPVVRERNQHLEPAPAQPISSPMSCVLCLNGSNDQRLSQGYRRPAFQGPAAIPVVGGGRNNAVNAHKRLLRVLPWPRLQVEPAQRRKAKETHHIEVVAGCARMPAVP